MKKSINIGLILLLLFQACSTEENSSDNINIESSTEETIINDSSSIDKVSTENIVEELLAEFPQGIFYYLLKSEQVCLVEKAGSEVIRQMEKDLIEGNATQEKYQEYFKACNIPPPPDPGIGGRQPVAEGDNSPSEANQKQEQGNPVMQGTTLSSMHLSYLGSIRSLENNLGNIADPSLVQTNDGNLRVYFKNGNEPQAGISGYDNLIHSAVSSDGGRTWIVEAGVRVPVQSPIEALVIDGTVSAWGWKLSASGDSLVKYESSDGKNFQEVSIPRFVQSDCKDTDGNTFGP